MKKINYWVNKPVFEGRGLIDYLDYFHNTKKYYIINKIKKHIIKNKNKKNNILDFGTGHGGLAIDIKRYFKNNVNVIGYDVSKSAIEIANFQKKKYNVDVDFIFDDNFNLNKKLNKHKFDVIVSTDVFGHLPELPKEIINLNSALLVGGILLCSSETITGKNLWIANYLLRNGVNIDESYEEHISLYSNQSLYKFLEQAEFSNIKIYPFDPVRFIFYPKRYIKYLKKINTFYYLLALFFSLFQNRFTEIIFCQINLALSLIFYDHNITTAGCLIFAEKIRNKPIHNYSL